MLPHIHHLIHLQALGHLVRDEDHRHLAFEPVDGLGEVLGGLLIQVRNRLVENQHLGTLEQRAGNGNALALPPLQLPQRQTKPGWLVALVRSICVACCSRYFSRRHDTAHISLLS